MIKHVLYIQGGAGEEDYEADSQLVVSFRKLLGENYQVHYPLLNEESTPGFGRKAQIYKAIAVINDEVILVGLSLGASMLLKYLSESSVPKKIAGVFLISTPFWRGDEDWKQGLKLRNGFSDNLPESVPVFLYHCRDDEEVPFEHLSLYAQHLPKATIREIPTGGHQLDNDLSQVANDIKSL